MLVLYFSGTGNTKYVAELFAGKMGAKCLSIEDQIDFATEITVQETIAICYPIYGSRAPLIMRRFVAEHLPDLKGKKLVILVTQWYFSGDGARSLLDLLPVGHVEVLYAEHILMPNNVSNLWPLFRKQSRRKLRRYRARAERKLERVCKKISAGRVKKRGFSKLSRAVGGLQGNPWLRIGEDWMGRKVIIYEDACIHCGLCAYYCPMQNLEELRGKIVSRQDCTVCYRCVNFCPERAITVFFKQRPKWQYQGVE